MKVLGNFYITQNMVYLQVTVGTGLLKAISH